MIQPNQLAIVGSPRGSFVFVVDQLMRAQGSVLSNSPSPRGPASDTSCRGGAREVEAGSAACHHPGMDPHETRLRVRYGETDQMGVVHHANYALYVEESRTNLMRERGCSY